MDQMYLDGKYLESNPTWHEEDAPWKASKVHAILADNDVRFDSFAEVGCGTGEILVRLAQHNPHARFTGYDISPHAVELAAKNTAPRLEFYLKDALAETDVDYDVVLIADVIEHVEDYIGFVRKVKDLGRYKVFHIPLDLSVQSLVRMWPILRLREDVGHIHYFTRDTALALLTDCGYRVIDSRYTASRLELPNQATSSKVVAPLRKALHRLRPDLTVRVLGGYSLLVLAE